MFLGHIDQTHLPLPVALNAALNYLRHTDFSQMAPGRYPIDGDNMIAIVQTPLTQPWETGMPEFHQRYIDIQYLLEGEEVIGYLPANLELERVTDQLTERDIAFVHPQANETRLVLTPGMFAIFFPGELHKPCRALNAPMLIRKVVIKIDQTLITG
ncbi:YhcH/YjgK/YiaL family protein [Deefgea rivuli]|uniref:YhcH/YjgK/YiaL family protein n=1 Tax=Deefgea rivuli TaxID=400948 RepID=UPI000483DBF3|nr:YhcH/YjgK/YiaL family protein [Deefgea rivuli]